MFYLSETEGFEIPYMTIMAIFHDYLIYYLFKDLNIHV